jgi:hypothetical protein
MMLSTIRPDARENAISLPFGEIAGWKLSSQRGGA